LESLRAVLMAAKLDIQLVVRSAARKVDLSVVLMAAWLADPTVVRWVVRSAVDLVGWRAGNWVVL
jgi:hypothetical protein